jgi:hypothetical protein
LVATVSAREWFWIRMSRRAPCLCAANRRSDDPFILAPSAASGLGASSVACAFYPARGNSAPLTRRSALSVSYERGAANEAVLACPPPAALAASARTGPLGFASAYGCGKCIGLGGLGPRAQSRRFYRPPSLRRRPARRRPSRGLRCGGRREGRATWLILPVVICLSQRLSHACVSMNQSIR